MPADEQAVELAAVRERSKAAWEAVAPGWFAYRNELWAFSRPVAEWMVRRLDPQPGDTVLDVAAGLGEIGFLAAQSVGERGRLISTDIAPAMVEAARLRAEE